MGKTPEQLALEYPHMKADIDLCYEQLFEICRGERNKAVMSVPPRPTNFDMQFSAALDELKDLREKANDAWISVYDRLPAFELTENDHEILENESMDKVVDVIAAIEELGVVTPARFSYKRQEFTSIMVGAVIENVSHWMPLPRFYPTIALPVPRKVNISVLKQEGNDEV